MVRGILIENVPFIPISISSGELIESPVVILDTGFTGDLQITPDMAENLQLQTEGVAEAKIANGETVKMPTTVATASLEGVNNQVQILISEGASLLGINLLKKFGYKAVVDCKNKDVFLEKPA